MKKGQFFPKNSNNLFLRIILKNYLKIIFGHDWNASEHLTKSSKLTCYLFLATVSLEQNWDTDCFLLEIFMIKVSSNLIGQEHILIFNLKSFILNWWKNAFAYLEINWSFILIYAQFGNASKTPQIDPCQVCVNLDMAMHAWTCPIKSRRKICYLSLVNVSMQKIIDIQAFF